MTYTAADRATIREAVITLANHDNAQWPQYRGYWDGPEWRAVRIRRDVKTKMGLAFATGELTIARTETLDGQETVIAYSVRNRINTALRPRDFEWLEDPR